MSNTATTLGSIADFVGADPGLSANIVQADIDGGVDAALLMNELIAEAIDVLGLNDDGIITERDAERISDYIRADPDLYAQFVEGHGDDEAGEETGYHLVQGDGGAYRFQGRDFVDTVGDAIYHVGFIYENGRFVNEDGDANETVADVAGWINYFLNGVNAVFGSSGDDRLSSGHYSFDLDDAQHETFYGYGGNDQIWAGLGHDMILGGNGNDRSGGGEGNDTMHGQAGNDTLSGEEGHDRIIGGAGDDEGNGGTGRDTILGGAGDDGFSGAQGNDLLRGNNGNDTLWLNEGDDRGYGDAGNDRMGGGTGNDRMFGGTGDDTVAGDEGNDLIKGQDGHDKLYGGDGADTIFGGDGKDYIGAGEGHDRLMGEAGNDTIYGEEGNDRITGDEGKDRLSGGDGADNLSGGFGDDWLSGGDGNDTLDGGASNDTLHGGDGADIFDGGRGADLMQVWENNAAQDIFIFQSGDSGTTEATMDVIEGFQAGIDKLDLTAFGPLSYEGDGAFAGGGAASARFDDGRLEVDEDGDGTADFAVEIKWISALSEGDFLLA